jgi:hypothetical protein
VTLLALLFYFTVIAAVKRKESLSASIGGDRVNPLHVLPRWVALALLPSTDRTLADAYQLAELEEGEPHLQAKGGDVRWL